MNGHELETPIPQPESFFDEGIEINLENRKIQIDKKRSNISFDLDHNSITKIVQKLPSNQMVSIQNTIQPNLPIQNTMQSNLSSPNPSNLFHKFGSGSRQKKKTEFVDEKMESNVNITDDFVSKIPLHVAKVNYVPLQKYNLKQKKVENVMNNRQITEAVGFNDTLDAFDNTTTKRQTITSSSKSEEIRSFIDRILSQILVDKKKPKAPSNHILFDNFKDTLINIMKLMSPEDNGILLDNLIFGCIINRTKMSGAGSASAINSFGGIISEIDALTYSTLSGSSNGEQIEELVRYFYSNSCESYRTNVSNANQAKDLKNLLVSVKIQKIKVLFPIAYKVNSPDKDITILGKPNIDTLRTFYVIEKKVAEVKKQSKKTIYNDEDNDNYDDQYDRYY